MNFIFQKVFNGVLSYREIVCLSKAFCFLIIHNKNINSE